MSRARLFGNLDELVATSRLVVDRPAGSRHPRVREAVYPVDYGYLEGTVAADGDGVDVFRGSAVGAGVVGFFVTADPGKRDVEVKVLIDCAAEEIERVRRLLDDVLGIGGLLVRRNLGAASGADGPTAGEKPGAQGMAATGTMRRLLHDGTP